MLPDLHVWAGCLGVEMPTLWFGGNAVHSIAQSSDRPPRCRFFLHPNHVLILHTHTLRKMSGIVARVFWCDRLVSIKFSIE